MALNTALKMAILTSGLTQTVLSQKVGIHETKLSQIVRGHRQASEAERKAIARALRSSVHVLFPEAVAS